MVFIITSFQSNRATPGQIGSLIRMIFAVAQSHLVVDNKSNYHYPQNKKPTTVAGFATGSPQAVLYH